MNYTFVRAIGDVLSLYMLLILVRWFAPRLDFDLRSPRWAWIPRITDPLIGKVRSVLPPMGPMDFGPLGALLIVWLLRGLLVGTLG